MNTFFKELFEYNNHFNQQLVDSFLQHSEKISEKSARLLNHLLNAHQIWNNRIEPNDATFGVFQMHALTELKSIDTKNYEGSLRIIDTFDLNTLFEYTNSKGQTFKNSVRDTLFHVINHSSYHRGQIASEFRGLELEPLITDYIFYKRA